MRSQVVLVAVLALALLALLPAPAGAQADDAAASPSGHVTITVRVAGSGDARWNVSTTYPIRTENESAAFERLATEYENGGDGVGFSARTFERLAAAASEQTGRQMAVRNVSRRAFRVNHTDGTATGVVSLEFTWTSFARSGRSLVVGDAFADGWHLAEDQTLRLEPPTGYAVSSVQPSTAIDNGTVRWTGPLSFDGGEPRVVYVRRARTSTGETTTPTSGGTGGATTSGPGGNGGEFLVPAGVVTVLVLAGAAAVLLARRTEGEDGDDGGTDGPGAADGPGVGGDGGEVAVEPPSDPPVDPELLSDEERVERLLRAHGGRMKQANIVDETNWSNAKVSQLLSSMAEAERVEKLRIGRENLITLVDGDGDGADEAKG